MSEARDAIDTRLRHIEETAIRSETLLNATLPQLATRAELTAVTATVTHLATKAELADARTQIANVRTALATIEVRLIRWAIGIGIATVLALSAQLWGAVQLLLRAHG